MEDANVLPILLATRLGKVFHAEFRRDSPGSRRVSLSQAGEMALCYPVASTRLDRRRRGVPPWAAFCSGPARFVVAVADGPASFPSPDESPPNSAEATELLIEFCAIYGLLEPEHQPDGHPSELSPAFAAFLAALVLPFYRHDGLRPQFPSPILKRCDAGTAKGAISESARIRQYTADLRYYMTLCMNTKCLGSALWSIFWQPDIETNLVSPWLSSISHVLNPS